MSDNSNGLHYGRTALILYGSETGNTQDGAEQLGRITERLRFETAVVPMDLVELNILSKFTVVIFAISTTGQGDIPANARRFWRSLLRKRLPPGSLADVAFTTFGFGDSSYVKFNWAARKLHKRLEQLGANEVYPRGEADEQHEEGTDGAFLPWSVEFRRHLLQRLPLPEGVLPIADSELLPPRWTVQLAEPRSDIRPSPSTPRPITNPTSSSLSLTAGSQQITNIKMDGPITKLPRVTNAISDDELTGCLEALPLDCLLPVPDEVVVYCESNKRITPNNHWQDVRHINFLVSGKLRYSPGDVITIYPKNFPQDVESLIALQGWTELADKPIIISPRGRSISMKSFIPQVAHMPTVQRPTLRSLLTNNLDINSVPRRHFFENILRYTDDPMHRERLLDFINPAYSDEFFDYTTRPRRTIIEVLQDFPTIRIPWHLAPSIIPEIRGRQYSICSGGEHKIPVDGGNRVEICVALVKYQTVLKKTRQGLCSRYLASLKEGSQISISFTGANSFHITIPQLEKPIIMIAPGTGIAPMRALLWERAYLKKTRNLTPADAILIYGGRNRKADFLFQTEWLKPDMQVKVHTAFSRDQKEKRYVQDVIREQGTAIYDMLVTQEGSVFICGSSGKMPIAVRAALVDVFYEAERNSDFNYTKEHAEALLNSLEKNGRYTQDTW